MPTISLRRWLLPALAGVVILIVGAKQFQTLQADTSLMPAYDFVQYWSAGRLLLDGGDPYDPDQLVVTERQLWGGVRKAIMMWNPPWALPITLPFASLPWRWAQLLWIGLQFAAVLLSVDWLWRLFKGPDRWRWIAWLVALGFAPTLFLLMMGQISGWVLLGVSGFIFCERRHRPGLAGAFAALTAIKPHLLAVWALVFVLEAIYRSQIRKSALIAAAILTLGGLLPLAWNGQVWAQYFAAMSRPPSTNFETMQEFEHPTVGYWLRSAVVDQPFAAQFVPLAIALPITLLWWFRHRGRVEWLQATPWLVLFSLLTAAYGAWAFDLVLLLAPITHMVTALADSKNRRLMVLAGLVFVVLNLLCLLTIRNAGSQANPWITPLVFLAYAGMHARSIVPDRAHAV